VIFIKRNSFPQKIPWWKYCRYSASCARGFGEVNNLTVRENLGNKCLFFMPHSQKSQLKNLACFILIVLRMKQLMTLCVANN